MTFRVLAVCVGNVCRSPQIERLLAARLPADAFTVESAGTRALAGHPMDAASAAELTRLGGTPDGFVSRQLTGTMADGAGLVLVATKALRSRVLEDSPGALRRTFTLREFAALVDGVSAESPAALVADAVRRRASAQVADYDLPDPINQSAEVHREVADLVDDATRVIARALAASAVTPG